PKVVDPTPMPEVTGDDQNQAGHYEQHDSYVQREHSVGEDLVRKLVHHTFHRATRDGLLVQKAAAIEAPGGAVVQVEVSVGAEVLAGKELPVGARDQPRELLVGQFVELVGCDRLADSEFACFHHHFGTVARTAHARAIREIDPFEAIGSLSRMRSRSRALDGSSSDIASAGAGPWPPRKGCQ